MRELFAALPDEPAPPAPPDYLETVLTLGRRSTRRRRISAAVVWAVVVIALAMLIVPVASFPAQPVAPSETPSLPDRFAGYSLLTSTIIKAPPGRAIALYSYGNGEMFNMFQSLLIGADQNTYRRVDGVAEPAFASAMLAPTGTRVLLADGRAATTELVLVDLGTGQRRSIPLGSPVAVRLLAWSPDQRYVAYSVAPPSEVEDYANAIEEAVHRVGVLRLLDLATGRSTEVPSLSPTMTAAFAPDSTRLAVQVGGEAHLLDLKGQETGRVPFPEGHEMAANVGWTPDGAFLTTVSWVDARTVNSDTRGSAGHEMYGKDARVITFVALAADGPQPPAPVHDVAGLLGWRSSSSMIVATYDAAEHLSLTEVSLRDGTRTTLSRFDTGSSCEFGSQPCHVFGLQLATGLLPDVTVRSAGRPQLGPWPTPLTVTVAIVAVVAAGLLLRRRVRKTRRVPNSHY